MSARYQIDYNDQNVVVFDKENKYRIDLRERLLEFSVSTIQFLASIPYKKEYDVFRYQLSKSASSIGANYEESQATTVKEFHNKISICVREARESHYWLKIIDRLNLGESEQRHRLLQECELLTRILGAIKSKVKND